MAVFAGAGGVPVDTIPLAETEMEQASLSFLSPCYRNVVPLRGSLFATGCIGDRCSPMALLLRRLEAFAFLSTYDRRAALDLTPQCGLLGSSRSDNSGSPGLKFELWVSPSF